MDTVMKRIAACPYYSVLYDETDALVTEELAATHQVEDSTLSGKLLKPMDKKTKDLLSMEEKMTGVKLLLSIKAITCITKSTEELEKLATDWYNLKMKAHESTMTYAVRVKEAAQQLEGTSKAVSKEDIAQKWKMDCQQRSSSISRSTAGTRQLFPQNGMNACLFTT